MMGVSNLPLNECKCKHNQYFITKTGIFLIDQEGRADLFIFNLYHDYDDCAANLDHSLWEQLKNSYLNIQLKIAIQFN